MLARHVIQELRTAGHTQSEASELTGVSERGVRRIENEDPVTELADISQTKKPGLRFEPCSLRVMSPDKDCSSPYLCVSKCIL